MENDELLALKLPVQRESIIKVIGVGGGGKQCGKPYVQAGNSWG